MLMEYHLSPFLLPALLDPQVGLKNSCACGICAATIYAQILFKFCAILLTIIPLYPSFRFIIFLGFFYRYFNVLLIDHNDQ